MGSHNNGTNYLKFCSLTLSCAEKQDWKIVLNYEHRKTMWCLETTNFNKTHKTLAYEFPSIQSFLCLNSYFDSYVHNQNTVRLGPDFKLLV